MSGQKRECGSEEHAFEVGHEGFCSRVEGVHDHLSVGRTCDLDPPVFETRGRGCTDPRVFSTNAGGLGREIEFAAIIELFLNGFSSLEEGLTSGLEGPVEGSQEFDGIVSEDSRLCLWGDFGEDVDAFYSHCCLSVRREIVDSRWTRQREGLGLYTPHRKSALSQRHDAFSHAYDGCDRHQAIDETIEPVGLPGPLGVTQVDFGPAGLLSPRKCRRYHPRM